MYYLRFCAIIFWNVIRLGQFVLAEKFGTLTDFNETQSEYLNLIFEIMETRKRGKKPIAYIHTYGCQQNVADGEKLAGLLKQMGYGFTYDVTKASLILYNTCAVRENAEEAKDAVVEKAETAKERIGERFEKVKDTVEDKVEQAKDVVEERVGKAKTAIGERVAKAADVVKERAEKLAENEPKAAEKPEDTEGDDEELF